MSVVTEDEAAVRPVRRRRRGFGIGLLVLLVVLAGLLLVADRVAAGMAESRLVSAVAAEEKKQDITSATTDVNVAGFPFLTQVARGVYDQITIDLGGLKSGSLRVSTLHIDAFDVHAKAGDLLQGETKARAERVSGVATIAWDQLPDLLDYAGLNFGDATFAQSGDGVRVTGTAKVNDQKVPVAATAKFSVSNNQIKVKISDASIAGTQLPQEATDYINQLQDSLSVGYKVPPLPFGLTVRKVAATKEGLAVTATAKDVALAQ